MSEQTKEELAAAVNRELFNAAPDGKSVAQKAARSPECRKAFAAYFKAAGFPETAAIIAPCEAEEKRARQST